MSAAEVVYRIKKILIIQLEMRGIFTVSTPPEPNFDRNGTKWLGGVEQTNINAYCTSADDVLAGRLDVFDLKGVDLGIPANWNRDPLTGKSAPMTFGKALDYREEELVGNIKYLWEPSRHLQLVTLAQAYHQSGREKYLKGISGFLRSWFQQCPYLHGPHWVSSLELAIRLINWNIAWQLIGGIESELFKDEDGLELRDLWLKSIYQHVHFIQGYYSMYSSANNHRIGEAAGVFIATVGWPYWRDFERWGEAAADILEDEVVLQNTVDGVNREQAISYQQFVLDFLLLSELASKSSGTGFSERYVKRLEKMLEFVCSVMDVGGNIPMIGDADDGYVVRLNYEKDWCPFKSLLVTGSVLFNRADFKVKAGAFDSKSMWLLGSKLQSQYEALPAVAPQQAQILNFPEGGYYILGEDYDGAYEVKIVADAGAIGYLNIAAHGHADALSFSLSVAGTEILIDPGTYSYHTEKKWRNYFRGTSAHNTVRVDCQDQSEIGGNFMWIRKANITDLVWNTSKEEDELIASHDGYRRLYDPVLHGRRIRYIKGKRTIQIEDTLHCEGSHHIEIHWHFSEECRINRKLNSVSVVNGDVRLTMTQNGSSFQAEIVQGRGNPPMGWVSRSFAIKEPTPTVIYAGDIVGTSKITTEIQLEELGKT